MGQHADTSSRLVRRLVITLSVFVIATVLFQPSWLLARTPQEGPLPAETASQLYLPLTVGGAGAVATITATPTASATPMQGASQTPTATPTATSTGAVTHTPTATPTTTLTPIPASFAAFWLTNDAVGASTSDVVRVDGAGGVHLVFVSYSLDQIVYGACAANCADPTHWSLVPVGARGGLLGGDPQLQLDPQGRPRLLWHLYQADSPNGDHDFTVYAECNSDCTQSNNWTSVVVANEPPSGAAVGTGMQRNFALDSKGRPGFVNVHVRFDQNTSLYDYTLVYHYCATNCTQAGNWQHISAVTYRDYLLDRFALTYGSDDLPRVAYVTQNYINAIQPQFNRRGEVGYIGCAANCTEADSWTQIVPLYYVGYRPIVAIDLDSQNRPRMAIYTRDAQDENGNLLPYANQIIFAYCDTGCTTSQPATGAGWDGYIPNFAVNQMDSVDMVLDGNGMPHMVFWAMTNEDKLMYAVCVAGCTTAQSQWSYDAMETNADLPPAPVASGCSFAAWYIHANPMSLAVESSGKAYFGYDTRSLQTCGSQIQEKLRYARLGVWPAP